jgi:flagellar biosynthesis chaperone FliJ
MLSRAQIREDAAQRELAARVRASEAQHQEHLEREARLRAAHDRAPGPTGAAAFQRSRVALAAAAQAVDDAAADAQDATEQVRVAQRQLLDRARERKTLERLDDRDRALLAVLASKAAQRSLDDLANRRRTTP